MAKLNKQSSGVGNYLKYKKHKKPSVYQDYRCPDCEGSGCEDFDGERPIKCVKCNGTGHTLQNI